MSSLNFKPDKIPLEIFELTFKLKNKIDLNITKASKLVKIVREPYNTEPNILLIDINQPNIPITMNRGLNFTDENTGNNLAIGIREITFKFVEYHNWIHTINQIIPIIQKICNLFQIAEFKSISMVYVDKFILKKDNFNFCKYFNTKIEFPNLKIDWNDFHLGIVPIDDESKKFVIRIRGRTGDDDNYYYFVDSVYSGKKEIQCSDKEILISELSSIHDLLEKYFLKILNDNFKNEIFD